jgi:glutathione S-transferase
MNSPETDLFLAGMPFGMLPVLEIDGKAVAQSNAVARYLARQYGLAGRSEWEALQCDVLVDTLGDLKQGTCSFITMQIRAPYY